MNVLSGVKTFKVSYCKNGKDATPCINTSASLFTKRRADKRGKILKTKSLKGEKVVVYNQYSASHILF